MDLFGLTPDRVMTRIGRNGGRHSTPSLSTSLLIGSLGFCFTSLCVFATVALGERWMYQNLGLAGAYLVWTLLFILIGGTLLSPLVIGPGRWRRFQLLFAEAFLLYSVGWTMAYFILRGAAGEWVGAVVSSVLMALVIALAFGDMKISLVLAVLLFVTNSAGYFLGELLSQSIGGMAGMILWGVFYGLFLGAGIGLALYLAQAPLRKLLSNLKPQNAE